MTTPFKAIALALPLTALLMSCGKNAPNDVTTTPSSTSTLEASTAQDTTLPSPVGSPAASPVANNASTPPPAFAVCAACHSVEAGRNGIGPTLAGIMGTKAGVVAGFNFSPALANSDITWDRASLDTWLQGPMKMVPGTRMVLPVADPAKRAEIIDYLETLK